MSRNKEKTQSMLFRFREQQAAEMGIIDKGRDRRPRDIRSVKDVNDCERWRAQVVRDISRKITRIHEPSVSEPQIRDLNDEINKLMREKYVWELQLKDLGGPNYIRFGGRDNFHSDKDTMTSTRGYKYFGRARDLPGVKELFEAQANQKSVLQNNKKDSHYQRDLPAAYYGLEDEDQEMLKEEAEAEKNLLSDTNHDFWSEHRLPITSNDEFSYHPLSDSTQIPTSSDIEKYLIERRRQKLEQMYL